MARQEFKQGETVMLHGYGDSWKPAVVVNPDIPKQEQRWGLERDNHTATVHYVEVWVGHFRTWTLRSNRRDILGMAEYESTVVVKANAKREAYEAHERQYEADAKSGLEMARADVVKAFSGAAGDLRVILKLWIGDHELARAGRLARKEGN